MTCEQFGEQVNDLALGQVAEPRRSELLEHAGGCGACAELLADVSAIGDRLLHLAPEADPPVGFEARAVARMRPGEGPAGARGRRSRALVAAVAAVGLLLAGIVAGVAIGRTTAGGDGAVVAAPILTRSGERIGEAELDRDDGRIVLTMDGPSTWSGTWTCELLVDGRWIAVGTWTADDVTNHVWAAGVDPSLTEAESMRILGRRGSVVATATLVEG